MAITSVHPEMEVQKQKQTQTYDIPSGAHLRIVDDLPDSNTGEYAVPSTELFEVVQEDAPYLVPRSLVNVCNQMRPNNEYGDLDELAESFIAVGQQTAVKICRWDREKVAIYTAINNALYKDREPIDVNDFTYLEDGSCLVLIYGHRRFRAAARAQQMLTEQVVELLEKGVSEGDEAVQELERKSAAFEDIKAKISDSMSVSDALTEQAAENIYHQPPAHAFAKALNEVYLLGKEAGQWDNVAAFSRRSGVGIERARNAVRYCRLPGVIIDQVESGKLSYAIATEVARLIRHITEHRCNFAEINGLPAPEQEYLDEVIDSELKKVTEELLMKHKSARGAHRFISNHINLHYKQLEFSYDPEEIRRKNEKEDYRKELRKHLRNACGTLDVVEVALAFAESMPDDIVAVLGQKGLQTLLGRVKELADSLSEKSGLNDRSRRAAIAAALALEQLILTDEIDLELQALIETKSGVSSVTTQSSESLLL